MADSNSQPPRCRCGFWGSTQTLGMCSKCYKELGKHQPGGPFGEGADALPYSQTSEHQQKNSDIPGSASAAGCSAAATGITSTALTKAMQAVTPMLTEASEPSLDSQAAGSLNGSKAGTNEEPMVTTESEAAASKEKADSSDTTPEQETSNESNGDDKEPASEAKRERKDSECSLDPNRPVQKNKKRCFKCNVKLELAIREIGRCRCDYIFCQLHRLPEQHDCDYDHKETGRQAAREKMVSPKKHVGTSLKRLDSDS